MAELKALLAEARSSLHDLDGLLQRARSLDRGQPWAGSESLQSCIDELLGVIARIPKELRHDERVQREVEIQQLHREMEGVRHRVEASIERMEAACEHNVEQLSAFIETLQERLPRLSQEGQVPSQMSPLNELLNQGRQSLANKDYEACLATMNEVLQMAPENSEAAACLEEAQRKLEDQRLEEELVIHLDNLKKEATDLFDQEKYSECVGLFKFLCELEPKNRMLQDYLELSLEKVREAEEAEATARAIDDSEEAYPTVQGVSLTLTRDGVSDPEALPSSARTDAIEVVAEPVVAMVPSGMEGTEQDILEDLESARPSPSLGAVFGVVAVLVFVLSGALLLRGIKSKPNGSLSLSTQPSGVAVLIDGQPRGETPLSLENLEAGEHTLSLTKEGFAPASQAFTISSGQPSSLSVQLQPLPAVPVTTEPLQREALALFERGMLLEAGRRCDSLLAKDPHNQVAAGLKTKIRDQYWQQSQLAERRGKVSEARSALQNLLRVSPQDTEALAALKNLQTDANAKGKPTTPVQVPSPSEKNDDLRSKIAAAMTSGNYFPPAAGNAWELIQRLGATSPSNPVFKERMDQIHREGITQLQRKIQSKDAEGAKALARQLQEYFPASAEIKTLRESIKVNDSSQAEVFNNLLQRVDSAMARGNYVTPVNDNALFYCSRILALDHQNAKGLALRRDITTRAAAQAKDLVSNEKFDEARGVFSALLIASQNEGKTAVAQEIRTQIDKLEFAAYPVIHDHTLGSCSGRLRINGYVVAYVPSGDSKDGFSLKLTDILHTEPGDKLKIQFKNKTYRFQPNLTQNKEESRQKVHEIVTKLEALTGKN